jgi:heme-degrading monooxygenase HmoA
MVIVLIRTQLRPDVDLAAYEALNAEMEALVEQVPGYVSAEGYGGLGVIRFASLEALKAWRDLPQHVVAQRRGRAEFYASYSVEVCDLVRAYDFETSVLAAG